MDNKKETIDTYDRGAYELGKKFNEIGPRIKDIERGFSYLKKKNPKTIELGCGNGRDAKEILKFTDDYLGIDASKEMVRLSKEYLPETNFVVSDMENFELPEKTDIVFAFASLLHLNRSSIKTLLEKIYKKLSDDGIIYVSVKLDKYQEKIKVDEFGKRLFFFYEKSDFENLAKETNYQIIYSDTQNLRGVDWLTVVLRKG